MSSLLHVPTGAPAVSRRAARLYRPPTPGRPPPSPGVRMAILTKVRSLLRLRALAPLPAALGVAPWNAIGCRKLPSFATRSHACDVDRIAGIGSREGGLHDRDEKREPSRGPTPVGDTAGSPAIGPCSITDRGSVVGRSAEARRFGPRPVGAPSPRPTTDHLGTAPKDPSQSLPLRHELRHSRVGARHRRNSAVPHLPST